MLFKVNNANLTHLRAAVEQYGEAWIHGDGNIYVDEPASNFRKDFSNPTHDGMPTAPQYRAHFKSLDSIPTSVDAMKKILLDNANRETEKKQETVNKTDVKIIQLPKNPALDTNTSDIAQTLAEKAEELKEREEEVLETEKEQSDRAAKITAANKELAAKAADLTAREKALEEKMATLRAAQPPAGEKAKEDAKDKKGA